MVAEAHARKAKLASDAAAAKSSERDKTCGGFLRGSPITDMSVLSPRRKREKRGTPPPRFDPSCTSMSPQVSCSSTSKDRSARADQKSLEEMFKKDVVRSLRSVFNQYREVGGALEAIAGVWHLDVAPPVEGELAPSLVIKTPAQVEAAREESRERTVKQVTRASFENVMTRAAVRHLTRATGIKGLPGMVEKRRLALLTSLERFAPLKQSLHRDAGARSPFALIKFLKERNLLPHGPLRVGLCIDGATTGTTSFVQFSLLFPDMTEPLKARGACASHRVVLFGYKLREETYASMRDYFKDFPGVKEELRHLFCASDTAPPEVKESAPNIVGNWPRSVKARICCDDKMQKIILGVMSSAKHFCTFCSAKTNDSHFLDFSEHTTASPRAGSQTHASTAHIRCCQTRCNLSLKKEGPILGVAPFHAAVPDVLHLREHLAGGFGGQFADACFSIAATVETAHITMADTSRALEIAAKTAKMRVGIWAVRSGRAKGQLTFQGSDARAYLRTHLKRMPAQYWWELAAKNHGELVDALGTRRTYTLDMMRRRGTEPVTVWEALVLSPLRRWLLDTHSAMDSRVATSGRRALDYAKTWHNVIGDVARLYTVWDKGLEAEVCVGMEGGVETMEGALQPRETPRQLASTIRSSVHALCLRETRDEFKPRRRFETRSYYIHLLLWHSEQFLNRFPNGLSEWSTEDAERKQARLKLLTSRHNHVLDYSTHVMHHEGATLSGVAEMETQQ